MHHEIRSFILPAIFHFVVHVFDMGRHFFATVKMMSSTSLHSVVRVILLYTMHGGSAY